LADLQRRFGKGLKLKDKVWDPTGKKGKKVVVHHPK
jgi:hypothetical protein